LDNEILTKHTAHGRQIHSYNISDTRKFMNTTQTTATALISHYIS